MGAYLLFAILGWWPVAVVSMMGLSFVTYGSTSHDLVHRTLRLPPRLNDTLLCLIELLSPSGAGRHAGLICITIAASSQTMTWRRPRLGTFWRVHRQRAADAVPALAVGLWRTHPALRVRLAWKGRGS